MRSRDRALLFALTMYCAACSDTAGDPLGPEAEVLPEAAELAGGSLAVMSRNLYVGADADAVIAALATPDPSDDLPALLTAVDQLRQTDWSARAAAIADEIARARPHAVGLQEVSTIDLTIPPLGVDVHLDFLPLLLAELTERGYDYTVAARVRNFEATPLPGVRLVDDDALLLDRSRVTIRATDARRYGVNLGPVAPGVTLERGWVSADVEIAGRPYTIASTHLESGAMPGLDQIRAAQAAELAQGLPTGRIALIMGDLNDVPGSPMHQVLLGAGFVDLWAALRPGTAGFTCCHAPDLSNALERFDERIDYVLVRGADGPSADRIDRVGEVAADRISGPDHLIWPSDHAGLIARLGWTEAPAAVR